MKRVLVPIVAVAAVALLCAPEARAETFQIDPSHSSVGFSVKHLMINNVRGEFGKVRGTVVFDEKAPAKSSMEAVIDVASISTRDAKRDEHLRSPDFFDAATYPTITFKSTRIEKAGRNRLRAHGDLTMRGVTRPVVLEIAGPSAAVTNPWGKTVRAASAKGKLNRKDFGITWNKTMDGGGLVVGDQVDLVIDVELVRDETTKAAR